jgi:hypothetical protein
MEPVGEPWQYAKINTEENYPRKKTRKESATSNQLQPTTPACDKQDVDVHLRPSKATVTVPTCVATISPRHVTHLDILSDRRHRNSVLINCNNRYIPFVAI